jgi:hypothetical protein
MGPSFTCCLQPQLFIITLCAKHAKRYLSFSVLSFINVIVDRLNCIFGHISSVTTSYDGINITRVWVNHHLDKSVACKFKYIYIKHDTTSTQHVEPNMKLTSLG